MNWAGDLMCSASFEFTESGQNQIFLIARNLGCFPEVVLFQLMMIAVINL